MTEDEKLFSAALEHCRNEDATRADLELQRESLSRLSELPDSSSPLYTKEELQQAFGGPSPFELKPATRGAFPGGIAEALAYYDTHLATCIAAECLLGKASDHCLKLAETAEAAAREVEKLTAAELAEVNLTPAFASDLDKIVQLAGPHILTFAHSARQYGAQRELLERTIAALRAAL